MPTPALQTSAVMLPSIITPSLLHSLRTYPQLPSNTWYFITGVTLSILNRPDEIPKVFQHAIDKAPLPSGKMSKHDEQLLIARRLREALVKAAAIGGLPKVNYRFSIGCHCSS
jgi:hypothetical protein